MLADDLAAAAAMLTPRDIWYHTWNSMAKQVARAERLSLRRDVVQTAQHLACSRPSSMRDTIDLAKPPYPLTWIEWADTDKREIREQFGLINMSGTVHPTRVGALVTQIGDDGDEYRVEFAWTHGGPEKLCVSIACITLNLGETRSGMVLTRDEILKTIVGRKDQPGSYWAIYKNKPAELEAYADLLTRIGYGTADVAKEDLNKLIRDPFVEPQIRQLYQANLADVDSETLFLTSFLLLFNTFNATSRKREDLSKINKSRKKQKKQQLLEYDTILMRLSKREREEGRPGMGGHGTGSAKMSHVCRGHYKRLTKPDGSSRLVWWRSHWRGSGARAGVGRNREVAL